MQRKADMSKIATKPNAILIQAQNDEKDGPDDVCINAKKLQIKGHAAKVKLVGRRWSSFSTVRVFEKLGL